MLDDRGLGVNLGLMEVLDLPDRSAEPEQKEIRELLVRK